MKHVFIFLIIWFLFSCVFGFLGLAVFSAIHKISLKEALVLYETKTLYIFLFEFIGTLSTIITVLLFCKIEEISIINIGLNWISPKYILDGFIFGSLPIILIYAILSFTYKSSYAFLNYNLQNIIVYTLLLVLGSFNEEILTRGYILRYLLKSKTKIFSLLMSSIIFSFFHLFNNNFNYVSFVNIFLAGVFLGVFYIYFQNLWFSISAHFAWNFFQGPIFGSPVSGLKTESILTQNLVGSGLLTGGKFGFEASIICTFLLLLFIYLLYIYCKRNVMIINLHK